MLYKTARTRIPVRSANVVFLRCSRSTSVSRFARDVLTTRLTGCKSTPPWDVLVADVSRGRTYDPEGLIASLSNDEDYQPQPDALHPDIATYE